MLPSISFTGNLVSDPEVRFITSGTAVARLRVAANERIKDDAGNWSDGSSIFLDVELWGNSAEHAAESLAKGDEVVVSGLLKLDAWTNDAGEKKTALRVTKASVGASIMRKSRPHANQPQFSGAPKKAEPVASPTRAQVGTWQGAPPANW